MVITRRMLPNLLRLTAVIALGIITLVGARGGNPPRAAPRPGGGAGKEVLPFDY